jgi:GT2 family glycosyltransferase
MVQADFPWVTLCANKTNLGYGAAANQAIAGCTAEYVLLLNSDTLLEAGTLRALSLYLDLHPRAAVVGPRLVNPDGTLQASCYPFPTPFNILLVNTMLGCLVGHVPILRDRVLHTWSHTAARVVPWVLGAALAIRREAFDGIGGFDTSFFMYYEEVDLCYRLHTTGWQVHFAPVTTVVHTGGASTMQLRTQMAVQFFTSLGQFYHHHYSRTRLIILMIIMKSIVLGRWLVDSARLQTARDPRDHARLTADVAAWQYILLGQRKSP